MKHTFELMTQNGHVKFVQISDPNGYGENTARATLVQLWQHWLDKESSVFEDFFNRHSEPFTIEEIKISQVLGIL